MFGVKYDDVLCCCDSCGYEIYDGDSYYDVDGFKYHEDCFDNDRKHLLKKHFGVRYLNEGVPCACAVCKEKIEADDERIVMFGMSYHDECFGDNVEKMLRDECDIYATIASV